MNMNRLSRRSLFLSVAGFAAAPAILGQGQGGHGGRGERQLEMLKQRLKLSDEQEEKVKEIFAEQRKKMREMRDQATPDGDRAAMRDQMMKLRDDTDKKLGKVFSKEQMGEYHKMRQEMRGRMGGGGGRGRHQ